MTSFLSWPSQCIFCAADLADLLGLRSRSEPPSPSARLAAPDLVLQRSLFEGGLSDPGAFPPGLSCFSLSKLPPKSGLSVDVGPPGFAC